MGDIFSHLQSIQQFQEVFAGQVDIAAIAPEDIDIEQITR